MEAARKIRNSVAQVALLRHVAQDNPALGGAVREIKRLQAVRFGGTYSDLLAGGPYAAATRFFLEELYSDKDYAQRDAQFARIAGAIERLFPEQVARTAVALAELHALTEELDQAMGLAWLAQSDDRSEPARYVAAWREVGRRPDREAQLKVVMGIGQQMVRLTRTPGLRMLLKMMRGPAVAAGLGSLQHFLETGFDTFAAMVRTPQGAPVFLRTIESREAGLIARLFDEQRVACETELARTLGQVP
jgi:hypothetical protein